MCLRQDGDYVEDHGTMVNMILIEQGFFLECLQWIEISSFKIAVKIINISFNLMTLIMLKLMISLFI